MEFLNNLEVISLIAFALPFLSIIVLGVFQINNLKSDILHLRKSISANNLGLAAERVDFINTINSLKSELIKVKNQLEMSEKMDNLTILHSEAKTVYGSIEIKKSYTASQKDKLENSIKKELIDKIWAFRSERYHRTPYTQDCLTYHIEISVCDRSNERGLNTEF